MKTVFIFGLGYVGTPLAQALADQGWQVRGTTRTPSKLADKANQGWQILPFQSGQPLTDPPTAFANIDAIISTITAIGGSDPVLDAHGVDLANFSGWTVVIAHGLGVNSSFLHLDRADVKTGMMVERGALIGTIGATGRATGPHLDWRIDWQGRRIDPGLLVGAMPNPAS